jgi:hypothetical protein
VSPSIQKMKKMLDLLHVVALRSIGTNITLTEGTCFFMIYYNSPFQDSKVSGANVGEVQKFALPSCC